MDTPSKYWLNNLSSRYNF
ncbi:MULTISPECIES: YsgD/CorL family protein [Buttiauxella]|uniref:YsgD/CorL family protein n=1 Tax=Buttiauxella gaviniae TaxID=82990 RepID=A0ABV3NU81_9ENTR